MKKILLGVALIMTITCTVFAIESPSEKSTARSSTSPASTDNATSHYEQALQAASPKEAVEEFSKALEKDPAYAGAYLGRGDAYAAMERAGEALSDYIRYLELRPDDIFGYLKRGTAYAFSGNFQKAIEDYDRVIKEFPNEANLYFSRGVCYELSGMKEQAVEDYKISAKMGYGPAQETLKDKGIQWQPEADIKK